MGNQTSREEASSRVQGFEQYAWWSLEHVHLGEEPTKQTVVAAAMGSLANASCFASTCLQPSRGHGKRAPTSWQ